MYVRDRSGRSAIPSTTGGFYVEMLDTHYYYHTPLFGSGEKRAKEELKDHAIVNISPFQKSSKKRRRKKKEERVESAHRKKNVARILKRWRSVVEEEE